MNRKLKKNRTKEDWNEYFLNHVLKVFMLYEQITDFSSFNPEYYPYIKNYFVLSRDNTICAFFMKLGSLMNNGTELLSNYINNDEQQKMFDDLLEKYKNGFIDVRDGLYAHNIPERLKDISISNSDIEDILNILKAICVSISNSYDNKTQFTYNSIGNDGIKKIEPFIKRFIEDYKFKEEIRKIPSAFHNGINVRMDMSDGNLKLNEINFKKIDIDFIEFYIQKKYSQKLEEYFDVNKSVSSKWRNISFPERRLKEFMYREGSLDVKELFDKIYS